MLNEKIRALSKFYPNSDEVELNDGRKITMWYKVDYADPSVGIFGDSIGDYDTTDEEGNVVQLNEEDWSYVFKQVSDNMGHSYYDYPD